MNARRLLKLLLAVLVAVGVTAAPLVSPAAAGHSVMATMQMADMQDMPDNMSCCPDEQNGKQCPDCPLVAICMLKVLQAGPSITPMTVCEPECELVRPLNELIVDGLTRPPPDHPPRYLA